MASELWERKEPLRVAHIMGKMMSGGVESMVMNYYRHIDREQVQFDFIIDADSTIVPYEEIESMGGRIFKIAPYQRPVRYHRDLFRLFGEQRWRIVHSHINAMSVFPLFAAKRAGVPVRIAHSHSTAGKGEAVKTMIKYVLRPFSKVFPTHYCACSEYAGRWLFGDRLVDSGAVMLVRNAIDAKKFAFDPQVRAEVRRELGLEGRLVLGHVGRFMKQKNHSFLIDIFDRLCVKAENSVLLLVGEGELEQEIRQKVERLGLGDSVRFLGVRDDVHRLLQAMDVFVLPSFYEGLPVVGVEAQASGLKMVASDAVTKEAKIAEDFVFLSLRRSAEEWAEKVHECAGCRREEKCIDMVRRGYDIAKSAAMLYDYYYEK